MSATEVAKVVDTLRARGVIGADAPAMPVSDDDRPWFIVILQAAAGWLAGVFLLVFIAAFLQPDSTLGITTCGVLLLAGAWALYFAARDIVFLEQLALALSIAGQIAIAWAVLKGDHSHVSNAALLLTLQAVVFVAMPNKQARMIAALFACCAWAYAMRYGLGGEHGDRFYLSAEGGYSPPRFGDATGVVIWIATWAPILLGIRALLKTEATWMARGVRAFARPGLVGLVLACAFVPIATEPVDSLVSAFDETSRPLTWWSLFPLLSIALAMCGAWCAFRVRSAGLLGLCVIAALGYLGRFYYLFGASLLAKSAFMLCIGGGLLGLSWLLARKPGTAA